MKCKNCGCEFDGGSSTSPFAKCAKAELCPLCYETVMNDYYTCKVCGHKFDIPKRTDKKKWKAFRVGLCVKCNRVFQDSIDEYRQDKMMKPGNYKKKGR